MTFNLAGFLKPVFNMYTFDKRMNVWV